MFFKQSNKNFIQSNDNSEMSPHLSGHSKDNKTTQSILKKVLITKKALVRILKDLHGNEMSASAFRIKNKNGEVITDSVQHFTHQTFSEFMDLIPNAKIYSTINMSDPENPLLEEYIVTQESNEMIVYRGIIFYKSSATSGGQFTKRLNTWIPSLGVDDHSFHEIGSTQCFKITKLDRFYDKKFSKPDESIIPYKTLLGDDLMHRLHSFDLMLLSAEIGGGFWDTEDGKILIQHLKAKGIFIQVGIVQINKQSEHTFDIPFEVTNTPEEVKYIADNTRALNNFFICQGGYLHHGQCIDTQHENSISVYHEIYKRANKATRAILIRKDLENYIHRIEKYKISQTSDIDFSYGFRIFKKSRALNRKANYLLAKELLEQLNHPEAIEQEWPNAFIVKNVHVQRQYIIESYHLDKSLDYVQRGIHSSELNAILKKASAC